ncbi:hypothetical protein [Taibaiella soli]|uniref:hypothetical protein n=1 Tax=Taibaiella soli TaxID=1649169 RepID=UPI000F4F4D77|nr:hypothetical protein [Taibaiella soli]
MKHISFTLLLCISIFTCRATSTQDSVYTFEAVNWHNWRTEKIQDCHYNRREYQNALLFLLKEGVIRDTVEKYLGKNEHLSSKEKDKAYYYIEWNCKTKEATYTVIITYKDDKIIKVRRSIFME